MRVIFLATPLLYMYAFVMAVLRGAGDSKTPFYFMLVSVAFDIGLNPVFIFGVGPIPRFGIAGSALATLVSQAISFTAMMIYLYRRRHPLVLHRDEWALLRLDWSVIETLIKKGIPMSAQMLVLSLSGILMISIVNRFGVDTSAAYGATIQLWNYIQMPAFAVGMAVSSMAAQNVGARKWDRVAAIARVGVVYATLLTGVAAALLEILNTRAYSLYLQEGSAAMAAAVQINRIATPSFVFFGITLVLFGVVRATGAVMAPLVALTLALLGVRVPLAQFLVDHVGPAALWWSFPLSSAFASLLAVLYYRFGGWRSAHMESAPVQTAEGA
jgi:putative MATE family efflux protein